MRAKTLLVCGVTLLLLFNSFIYPLTGTTLTVKVSGIQTSNGNIHVLIFNSASGFPINPDKAYRHVKSKATKGETMISLDNMPSGTYSIVAFHDLNGNQQFDKNWFGSPKEDYGFSNIPGEYCGTPSFQQTSFAVSPQQHTITVKLMHVD